MIPFSLFFLVISRYFLIILKSFLVIIRLWSHNYEKRCIFLFVFFWTGKTVVHTKDLLIDTSWSQNQKTIRFCPHSVNGWFLNVAGPNSGLSGTPHLISKKKQEHIRLQSCLLCMYYKVQKQREEACSASAVLWRAKRVIIAWIESSFMSFHHSKEWRLMQIDSGPANWTLARRRLLF